MRLRTGLLLSVLLSVASLLLPACSGGGASPTGLVGCTGGSQGLCVTRCNLGCSSTGCEISEIAVNQPLSFDFNFEINPDTVTSNTVKMRTASGAEPVGSFLVQGGTVFFFPEARLVGTNTYFGFASGETYTLTIPSGKDSALTVESMSGDKLASTFSCRLNVTKGIVDFDGKSPSATLLVPNTSTCAAPDTVILLEFSEIIDAGSVLGDSKTAGVVYSLAQFDALGQCSTKDQPIGGTRILSVDRATQRSRLLFRPAFTLPGDFCVRISVTDRVKDLAGKRAKPVTFEFKTCRTVDKDYETVETFGEPGRTRDDERDGANWAKEAVTPRVVGGSGELGDFDIKFGGTDTLTDDAEGRRIWEWNTDNTTIPGVRTLSGQPITVTNGVFQFTNFRVRESDHLRFVGSKVPVIKVTGLMKVEGVISQSGLDMVRAKATQSGGPLDGQAGGRAGIGGGRGGKAGDSPKKAVAVINGADGEAVTVPSGHPLAGFVAGSGGKGSTANPATGRDQDITFSAYSSTLCQQGAAGGGGGGFVTAGVGGRCFDNNKGLQDHPPKPADLGPPSGAGIAVPFQDKVLASTEPSSFRFQAGGAGGGGGGAHPHGANTFQITWSSGGAGAGGGGPLQIKVGGELQVATRGRILARGGNGHPIVTYDSLNYYNPAPGGAGAGGTILIQLGGVPSFLGLVDARGGNKGLLDGDGGTLGLRLRVDCESGSGGNGFIRVEANPPLGLPVLGTFQPPATADNSGLLRSVDEDTATVVATKFYDTGLFFPPRYLRYEIQALVNQQPVTFSDDATLGQRADDAAELTFLIQGASIDPDTKLPDPETYGKWYVGYVDGLNTDGGNGFRFMIRFRRDRAAELVIKSVKVVYRA